jgi:hypothetical protein
VLIQPVDRKTFEERTFPRAYDVIVYTENNHYYAKDRRGNLICVDSSTACIQEAIDYLTNGGKIFIKSGVYYINNTININKSGVMIEGEQLGYGDIPGTKLVLNGNFHMMYISALPYFTYIRNIWLYGNDVAKSAIYINGANDVTIEHCFIHRFEFAYIHVVGFMHILRIIDNWIESGAGQGIWLGGTSTVETVYIHNNYFYNVLNAVVLSQYPLNMFSVVIANNIIRATRQHAILIQKGNLVIVEGNAILDAGSASPNTYDGIRLENVNGVVVNGNSIINYQTSNMKYAIEEVGTADYNVITNNVVKSASSPAIVKLGANTISSNNITLP